MTYTIIVAQSLNGVIGRDGRMPWHLPTDLSFFRRTTEGHVVIMGRKTFESVGRPLPNRRNLVLSRSPDFSADGVETFSSVQTLKEHIVRTRRSGEDVFVIG